MNEALENFFALWSERKAYKNDVTVFIQRDDVALVRMSGTIDASNPDEIRVEGAGGSLAVVLPGRAISAKHPGEMGVLAIELSFENDWTVTITDDRSYLPEKPKLKDW